MSIFLYLQFSKGYKMGPFDEFSIYGFRGDLIRFSGLSSSIDIWYLACRIALILFLAICSTISIEKVQFSVQCLFFEIF